MYIRGKGYVEMYQFVLIVSFVTIVVVVTLEGRCAVENPLQSAMLEAVASRIRNRENPEQAAITESIVQDWRLDVTNGVAGAIERIERNRLEALNPPRTLSSEEIAKINETYDKIVGLYESVLKPVRR
jgi:hypothetical protein